MERVRFAPSPTGYLHVGGARTALFNYLQAGRQCGTFILRIEDTDIKRSTDEMSEQIIRSLEWLGIKWDEGPFYQSQRMNIYSEYAQKLIDAGKAYYCYCANEENISDNANAETEKENRRYSGKCRNISKSDSEQSQSRVIRLKIPENYIITVHDKILGDVKFNTNILDDFVLIKSDGMPTYHFAVVIDDMLMKVDTVIRGNDHLSNTPKQILLYEAFAFKTPDFAHLPLILGPDKKRFSKRHGAVSVEAFKDDGIFPEALINYLALLGWSPPDTKEILDISELKNCFDIIDAGKKDAVFDYAKLDWLNAQYLIKFTPEDLYNRIKDYSPEIFHSFEKSYCVQIIKLLQPRIKKMSEFRSAAEYFFNDNFEFESAAVEKYFSPPDTITNLKKLYEQYSIIDFDNEQILEKILRDTAASLNISAGKLIHPLRICVSGRQSTPGIFEVIRLLGKNKTLSRIEKKL